MSNYTEYLNSSRYYIVAEMLNTMKMNHKIQIDDIGALEKQEQQSIALRKALYTGSKAIDVANYHTYEEVDTQYQRDITNHVAIAGR